MKINKSFNKINRAYNFNGFKNRNNSNNNKLYLNKSKSKNNDLKIEIKKQDTSHSFCYSKFKVKNNV